VSWRVLWQLNGQQRAVKIKDKRATVTTVVRPKAVKGKDGSIGAPMPGLVTEVKVREGQEVKMGEPLCVLSAMKMETVVGAKKPGKIVSLPIIVGDNVAAGDLLVEIE
jgi:pyruvate carboxylase